MQTNSTPLPRQFGSIAEFMAAYGSTKGFIADRLCVSRFQLNGLLLEPGYQPPVAVFDVRDGLADRIAALIGQTPDFVRDFYRRKAA